MEVTSDPRVEEDETSMVRPPNPEFQNRSVSNPDPCDALVEWIDVIQILILGSIF